jgi:hypothetical protein
MISFRRCSQRTLPKQEFEDLTLCGSKVEQLRAQDETGKRLSPNSPLSLDLPRPKTGGRKAIGLVLG